MSFGHSGFKPILQVSLQLSRRPPNLLNADFLHVLHTISLPPGTSSWSGLDIGSIDYPTCVVATVAINAHGINDVLGEREASMLERGEVTMNISESLSWL